MKTSALLLLLCVLLVAVSSKYADDNKWYVLLGASKFFFNYRHTSDPLSLYNYLRSVGVRDDRIILMLSENYACNARNAIPGGVFREVDHQQNLHCDNVEIDYRGADVSVSNIMNLLRGKHDPETPISRRLLSNEDSHVVVYMNGHGGDNFFKIQDTQVLHSKDLAEVINEMYIKKRYKKLFLITDTCQANTLYDEINSPNIFLVGSSLKDENALSHNTDSELNTFLNDKFTYFMYDYLRDNYVPERTTMQEFLDHFDSGKIWANMGVKNSFVQQDKKKMLLKDFFPDTRSKQENLLSGVEYIDLNETEYQKPADLFSFDFSS